LKQELFFCKDFFLPSAVATKGHDKWATILGSNVKLTHSLWPRITKDTRSQHTHTRNRK